MLKHKNEERMGTNNSFKSISLLQNERGSYQQSWEVRGVPDCLLAIQKFLPQFLEKMAKFLLNKSQFMQKSYWLSRKKLFMIF